MNRRHAICIVVDGLRASALGCYGNTVYPTPYLDELASRSVVGDWLWADSLTLPSFYNSFWQGVHCSRPQDTSIDLHSLLSKKKVRQWLVTDDSWLSEQSSQLPFDDALLLEPVSENSKESIEDTQLASLFSETVLRLNDWLEHDNEDESTFLLLHTTGLTGSWDAPLALRNELLDESDPEVIDVARAPKLLDEQFDPDILHAYRVAYAAQVTVLDACVGGFCSALSEFYPADDTMVVLMGSRGFSLGEHGIIGWDTSQLFSENLHLPCLFGYLGNQQPMQRYGGLSQVADMNATLLDWFGAEKKAYDGISQLPLIAGDLVAGRELAVTIGNNNDIALRTPSWFLSKDKDKKSELYVKPDDLWEFNNVASLCSDEIHDLEIALEEFLSAASSGRRLPISLKQTAPADAIG